MKWTKTGVVVAVLAAGWWFLARAQGAAADEKARTARLSGVITPPNPDPKMVRIVPNPDPKMVVAPPWPQSK